MKVSINTNVNKKISFKGIYNNKFLLKGLKFAAQNGALFSAGVSLTLSTAARPIAIMATPKTDKEDKKIACTKSIASSLVGYMIMLFASMPVADAVKKIDKEPQKYLKQQTIKNLQTGSESLSKSKSYMFATQLFKLGIGFVMAIPKSILTCALIPPLLMMIFPHKKHKNSSQNPSHSKIISFKGIYNNASEHLAKGIGKIVDKSKIQNLSKKFCDTNFAQHIMSMTDALLTLSFVKQVSESKKIKNDRKKPLIYNSLISTALCISGGYAINSALKKPTQKFIKNFTLANKDLPELEKYIEGIKIAKPALILGSIYYIFIPVIATFLADRTKSIK